MVKPLNQTCKKITTGRAGVEGWEKWVQSSQKVQTSSHKSIHGDIKSSRVATVNKTVSHI